MVSLDKAFCKRNDYPEHCLFLCAVSVVGKQGQVHRFLFEHLGRPPENPMDICQHHPVIGYRYTLLNKGVEPVEQLLAGDHAAAALDDEGKIPYIRGKF